MFYDQRPGRDWGGEWGRERGGGSGGGKRGGHGAGYSALVQEPGSHLLFIGSYSCTRHKGTERLQLQQEGKLSFLCLQEIDWITGDYLTQIEDAAEEVARIYPVKKLILFGGCQLELLNVDFGLLTQQLTEKMGIPVEFHPGCHLVGYGQEGGRG
ncbi:MAG: hypothetical protein ACI3XJ_03220 [Oscillospiraceae bacterium]